MDFNSRGDVDISKRSCRGPIHLEPDEKRVYTVSARLNKAELIKLDQLRVKVGMQRGEYLRAASLHRLPPSIPYINRQTWALLSRAAANLNQLTHRLNLATHNQTDHPSASEITEILDEFRCELIGAKFSLDTEHESKDYPK